MSYEPTTWETGDTITANKLNKMENGIADANDLAPLLVTVTVTTEDNTTYHTANKTFNEVNTAFSAGRMVVFTEIREYTDDGYTVTTVAPITEIHIERYDDPQSESFEVTTAIGQFYPEDDDPDKNLVYVD